MTKSPERIPHRERAISLLIVYMALVGGLLILIGGLALNYGQQRSSPGFIGGLGQGITVVLPFFFVALAVQIMRLRDEYTRQLQFHAGWIAFTTTMFLSGVLMALNSISGLQAPAWMFFGVGMLSFGAAVGILNWRDRH